MWLYASSSPVILFDWTSSSSPAAPFARSSGLYSIDGTRFARSSTSAVSAAAVSFVDAVIAPAWNRSFSTAWKPLQPTASSRFDARMSIR